MPYYVVVVFFNVFFFFFLFFKKVQNRMLGISFSTLAVLDWLLFFVCLSLFVFAYSVCVLISSVMKRGLNRYDIIFTMQKICQIFHCPFSCVCPFVSFLGLRLFSRFPLLSFLDLVRSALGSWTREQKWQEKRIHAYGSKSGTNRAGD